MNTPDYLQPLRNTELEIMDVIVSVCRKNGLRCSLAYGSVLGAVRHGGFIPWDDDVDLMMPREDYETLLKIWKREAPEGYILQNKRTNPDFDQNFTKIRKDHTTFLQGKGERKATFHTGIFVDIFPADRAASGKAARKWQIFLSAVHLLYARGYTSKSSGIVRFAERLLLALPASFRNACYHKTEKAIGKWNGKRENGWYVADTIEDVFRVFGSGLFDRFADLPFEDRKYPCVADTKGYLTVQYGPDYMTPPPEEERVFKHNHAVISLDKNMNEIEGLD